jgi:hypothetical protein
VWSSSREAVHRACDHQQAEDQQPSAVDGSGDGSGFGVPVWAPSCGWARRQADGQQRDTNRSRIGEVVGARGEHPQRPRRQPDRRKAGDQHEVERKDDSQPVRTSHREAIPIETSSPDGRRPEGDRNQRVASAARP